MTLLKNVLIKEVGSRGDLVAYIDNLPKSLLYIRAKKMIIDYADPKGNQNLVPAFELNERGQKVFTNEYIDELQPGMELSQTGDGAYVFFTQYNEAKKRLEEIDRYIKGNVPIAERIQSRIPYAVQPGVLSSGPIPLSSIPHVVLSEPVSPPSKDVQVGEVPMAEPAPKTRHFTEAQKETMRERMANARKMKETKRADIVK